MSIGLIFDGLIKINVNLAKRAYTLSVIVKATDLKKQAERFYRFDRFGAGVALKRQT